MSFNKNKWSVFIEPTYQYFNTEKTMDAHYVEGRILNKEIKYQSIELPIGAKHYFFLNDKSKIFIKVSIIMDFCFNSGLDFVRNDGSLYRSWEIKSTTGNSSFGVGYNYNNKFGIEVQYQTVRRILEKDSWSSEYQTISINLGYTLF